jgi:hypothetical protein
VPFPLYHAYLWISQAVLALIHPNRYREHRVYLDSQISGVFPIAQAHRKPLFLHGSFTGEAELYHFLTQTFFSGGTSPQRTRSVGRGRSTCPSYHPPTPYTLSPLPKGGEGRGEGGSYPRMPCPFEALLVTLYHFFKSKAFLM